MGYDLNDANEHRFIKIESDIKDLQEKNSRDHKEFYNRIESVEKSMVESQGDRKHIREQLDKISDNLDTIMQGPANRYETIVVCVITAVVSAVVGFVLNGVI